LVEKFLIIGGDSQIGSYYTQKYPNVSVGTTRRKEKLLENASSIYLNLEEDISQWSPPIEISAAVILSAITSIEKCQQNPVYATYINVEQTKKLIEILHEHNIFIVFPSTNLVFNGTKPYQKIVDATSPQTEYGRNKRDIETFLIESDINSSIIRFSKILTPNNHLIQTWIKNLKQGIPIHPFYDMYISPISISFACMIIEMVLEKKITGIIQVSAGDEISYAKIAYHIAERLGYNEKLIQPISWKSSDIQMSHVPEHTTLDSTRLKYELDVKVPDVKITIDEIIEHYG
jgi:dTDP-4-dehydrorhamnose reductase